MKRTMRKLTAYIISLGLLVAACNPMEDIYTELDKKETPYVEKVELTLSDADYESMDGDVATNYSFSADEPADDYIPEFLEEKYPGLEYGSAALVTYHYSEGYPDLSAYTNAGYYSLSGDDYAMVSPVVEEAGYFSPKNPAGEFIPSILNASVSGAEEGDMYIVSYMYSDIEPEVTASGEKVVFEYEFDGNLGPFTSVDVLGPQDWYYREFGGTGYANMSGFSGGAVPNEDWLISPEIDLSGITDARMIVNQAVNYLDGDWDQVSILIAADYNGSDVSAASWTEIEPGTKPSGNNWDFVESEDMDISAFDGETIHVAFKYLSSSDNAATWEVNSLTVKGTEMTTKSGIIAEPVEMEDLYTYDSGWEKTEGAYYVKAIDYDEMGSPGAYNNFSDSDDPDNYLPQLLNQKFPYAQEADVMVVVYNYYSGGVSTRADEYHFTEGNWTKYDPVVEKTEQYILTQYDGWVFDPTVMVTITSSDYQIIVDWVEANKGEDFIDSYGTQEFYYGAGAYYNNFDIREGNWDSSFNSWQDAVKEAIGEILLPEKFPDAVASVSGIAVKYEVTFATYDGTDGEHTWVFQCTSSAPDPEFVFLREK